MIHAVVTAVWCLLCIFAGLPWPCLFWMPAFYFGREHAQAEERWMRTRNLKRSLSPWWIGFAPDAWDAKALLDCLLPLAVALAAWTGQAILW